MGRAVSRVAWGGSRAELARAGVGLSGGRRAGSCGQRCLPQAGASPVCRAFIRVVLPHSDAFCGRCGGAGVFSLLVQHGVFRKERVAVRTGDIRCVDGLAAFRADGFRHELTLVIAKSHASAAHDAGYAHDALLSAALRFHHRSCCVNRTWAFSCYWAGEMAPSAPSLHVESAFGQLGRLSCSSFTSVGLRQHQGSLRKAVFHE